MCSTLILHRINCRRKVISPFQSSLSLSPIPFWPAYAILRSSAGGFPSSVPLTDSQILVLPALTICFYFTFQSLHFQKYVCGLCFYSILKLGNIENKKLIQAWHSFSSFTAPKHTAHLLLTIYFLHILPLFAYLTPEIF